MPSLLRGRGPEERVMTSKPSMADTVSLIWRRSGSANQNRKKAILLSSLASPLSAICSDFLALYFGFFYFLYHTSITDFRRVLPVPTVLFSSLSLRLPCLRSLGSLPPVVSASINLYALCPELACPTYSPTTVHLPDLPGPLFLASALPGSGLEQPLCQSSKALGHKIPRFATASR